MLSYRITPEILGKLTYLLLKLKDLTEKQIYRERTKLYLQSLKLVLCRSLCFVESVTPVNSLEGVWDPALLVCQRFYQHCMLGWVFLNYFKIYPHVNGLVKCFPFFARSPSLLANINIIFHPLSLNALWKRIVYKASENMLFFNDVQKSFNQHSLEWLKCTEVC